VFRRQGEKIPMNGRRRRGRAGVLTGAAALTLSGLTPAVAAVPQGGPDVVGQWTPPFKEDSATPASAVQAAVLADGRVLYFNGRERGAGSPAGPGPGRPDAAERGSGPRRSAAGRAQGARARLLDLRSGPPRWATPAQSDDLSCADVATLPGGRLLVAGGGVWLYDPAAGRFEPAAPMRHDRRYGQLVVGPDGNATAFGGVTGAVDGAPPTGPVRRTETYDVAAGTWTENYVGPASETTLPPEPRVVLTPGGQFFYAAAGQMWGPFVPTADEAATAAFQFFDPKTRKWSVSGVAPLGARSGAFVAPLTLEPPYDQMTLVTWGGVLGPTPGSWLPANAFTTLTTIDADGNVASRDGGALNHARWQSSGVLLPDGQILAVGGADKDATVAPDLAAPVTVPELFDPSTGQWREVAAHRRGRGYHHTALLLPDMRVLLGGGDGDPSFEIWSPPYLFRGDRPAIASAPGRVAYGSPFTITTPDAGLVESVVLLRTPSPQHGTDSDQRTLRLEFTRTGPATLAATAPPSGRVAPPGPYYLVVNKRSLQGPIPSVASIVDVGTAGR
jgi:hypothetical protein